MGLPVQVPLLALHVCPWIEVPVIAGSAVLVGADPEAVTVAVWFDVALPEPLALVAVTVTRMVWSTSPAAST